MKSENVGARILSIITESLYDKPVVVFREYVQNSVDSFQKAEKKSELSHLSIRMWQKKDDLFFLDNGKGVERELFERKMIRIARSRKKRTVNVGYKGIGRLSGVPYCDMLVFINILSYKDKKYQKYSIDGVRFTELKNDDKFNDMDIEDLMNEIGSFEDNPSEATVNGVNKLLLPYEEMFALQDTGFLVILKSLRPILKKTINDDGFLEELGWLLPVKFKDELYKAKEPNVFKYLSEPGEDGITPAKAYSITYNETPIERPIGKNDLRNYECICNFEKYAVGVHSFFDNRISISKGNKFSGIRVYIDNILLCDENELLPILHKYGLIGYTVNELMQTVKGLGVMIYITDKNNISSNARRTFIEVTDEQSLEFLELLAKFIGTIYNTRYALSKWSSAKRRVDNNKELVDELRIKAEAALRELARAVIQIDDEEDDRDFDSLSESEQRQVIKGIVTKELTSEVKDYLSQTTTFDYDNAYKNFLTWLTAKH